MTIEENFGITFGLYFKLYNDYFSDNYKATIEFCANDMAFLHSKLCTSWYQSGKDIWPEAVSNPAVVQVSYFIIWITVMSDSGSIILTFGAHAHEGYSTVSVCY